MKKIAARLGVLTLLGAVIAVSALFVSGSDSRAQVAGTLDHFKCYPIHNPVSLSIPLVLQDQFDKARGVREQVSQELPVHLCLPVEKITSAGVVTPITNPDAHLKAYQIGIADLTTPKWRVWVNNQFGSSILKVFEPAEVLMVPTCKAPAGTTTCPIPPGLDHFKCYRATGRFRERTVDLFDQFHPEPGVKVLRVFGFCNPVEKLRLDTGQVTPITNPQAHLVCYTITPTPFTATVLTNNQFGFEDLTVTDANILCVPSEKIRFRPVK